MTQRVDTTGTTTITYDAMNRPLSKTVGSTVTSVAYDPADNITSYTDTAGVTSYRYDNANNVIALAEPGGACPVTAVFPNTTKCVGFGYDYAERRIVMNFPNGVSNTTTYDGSNRQTSITAANGGTGIKLAERDYVYQSGAGADTSLIQNTTDPLNGAAPGTINNYSYDHLNRLTTTATGPKTSSPSSFVASTTTNWTYDLSGNRTQQAITGTGAGTGNYGYNAADQLCWSAAATGSGCTTPAGGTAYSYDGNGNETSDSNTYSSYDQLASATTVGAQTYAGTTNNERTQAGSTNFTNSILGKISSTTTPYTTQEYVRDPGGTLIAMQNTDSGGYTNEYYYTADIVGSTIAVSNAAGGTAATYTYDSYGNTTTTTGGTFATSTNPWRYGAGYTDPNGTIKLGARYYAPLLGRFSQPDPSGQEANRYLYAGDDPIAKSDPGGLYPCVAQSDPSPDRA